MNRAEMRDWLRRMLGIQPPSDTTLEDAKPGDAPSWQPEPSNARLNQAIADACATINRRLRLTDQQDPISVTVSAQTDNGPYWVSLETSLDTLPARSITSITGALWNDGSTRTTLTASSLEELRRIFGTIEDTEPSTPTHYIVEHYRAGLWPAPDTAGTLELRVTTGLLAPQSDTEGFRQLPAEYDQCVLYTALVDVAKGALEDSAMAQIAKSYQNEAIRGEDELARWLASVSGSEFQSSFSAIGFVTYSYGRR